MEKNYEYRVQLGQQKVRNKREVEALLKAIDAKGSPVHSLMLTVDSLNGLDVQRRLLESQHLSCLENLALNLDFCLGAESLGVLAKVVEAGKLSSLQHLSICYRGESDEQRDFRLAVSHRSSSQTGTSQSRINSSSNNVSSSPRSRSPGVQSSSSSSSSSISTLRNWSSPPKDPVSWEGFASLAGVLRKNLLPQLEKTVSLNFNWGSKNLGDVGVKFLAELIDTGYLWCLKELDLENNSIGSAGIEALAHALRGGGNMVGLERLNLNRNCIHSDATGIMQVVKVMEADHLPALKWIGLSGAGRQSIANEGSIADAIVAVFTKNTALTAVVEMDWPDKRIQGRWNVVLERNLKLTKILAKLGREDEVPVTNGKIFICGFPGVGKTTLRSSLKRSRVGAFLRKELKPRLEKPTRGIEVTKIKDAATFGTKFTLTLWDLAGQEDFQVLHSSFLPDLGMANGKATTFLVVFNARYNRSRTESASAEEELVYWLRFIASNSIIGVKRKVLVILNTFNGALCTEKAQWNELLKGVDEKFRDVLDINTNPFVMDTRVAKSVNQLKQELFLHTRTILRDLRWPKICQYIQENLEGWSQENQKFPIICWSDLVGKLAASKLAPEKLEAAIEYLHETGDLIYFRRGSLSEGGNPNTNLIVLNPHWFCKRIVGQLLLPEGMLDAGESPLKKSVAPDGSLGIREIKAYFNELVRSDPQVDYVLGMLFRLGLCYKVGQGKVLIPALIEEDELPARLWRRDPRGQYCAQWVMGRSLALKDSERNALPKAVFRRLQVQLALDPELGGLRNSDYAVGKSYLSFRKSGMAILVQFDVNEDDPRDDRIDVISRPLLSRKSDPEPQRKEQIELVEKVMERLLRLCLEWCPGIQFIEMVILPWKASDGALPMLERNAKAPVEEIKRWLHRNGLRVHSKGFSDLNWSVGEEEVKEHDLLSNSEIREVQSWAEEAKGGA